MNLAKGLLIALVALTASGCGVALQSSDPQSLTLRECPTGRTDVFAFQCYCTHDNTGG
jgi:hypothetical protein